jgi:hypothetical protein
LTYDSGSGLYSKAIESISNISNVKWATGKVLVKPSSGSIKLCSTTTTPSISCSSTDLPALNPTDISSYLKFNGNNVFYAKDAAGNTVNPPKVGDIFGSPSALPFTVSSPSGGNASFDLTKFAFSFQPVGATARCPTHIAYLSSPTGPVKLYTLDRANTCVARILKVFP